MAIELSDEESKHMRTQHDDSTEFNPVENKASESLLGVVDGGHRLTALRQIIKEKSSSVTTDSCTFRVCILKTGTPEILVKTYAMVKHKHIQPTNTRTCM